MNDIERYEQVKQELDAALEKVGALQQTLKELKETLDKKHTLDEYLKYFEVDEDKEYKAWYINTQGRSATLKCNQAVDLSSYNPYCYYIDYDISIIAEKHRKFDDMLLAFKWCYDRDFTPNLASPSERWFVFYDLSANEYCCSSLNDTIEALVYFSSEFIAGKCCEWLNSVDPQGRILS